MLPALSFSTPIEPYALAPALTAADCDTAPGVNTEKPGVVAFRKLVMDALGGGDFGITRPCERGGPSDHKTGRAWDWKLNAADPADADRAQALFDWLFAPDADGNENALLRRAGITFLIWNKRSWSTKTGRVWGDYTGPVPHTDHVHISFGWPGSLAQTSLYGALGVAPSPGPPRPPLPLPFPGPDVTTPVVAAPSSRVSLGDVVSVAAGAAAGWYGMRWWQRRRR